LWLEREAIAQERFRKKKEDEERKLREKLEQEVINCMYTCNCTEKRALIVLLAVIIIFYKEVGALYATFDNACYMYIIL